MAHQLSNRLTLDAEPDMADEATQSTVLVAETENRNCTPPKRVDRACDYCRKKRVRLYLISSSVFLTAHRVPLYSLNARRISVPA